MIELIKTIVHNYRKEVSRRQKISMALKSYHATKRAEAGYHRVRYSENGIYKGYYLLKNL